MDVVARAEVEEGLGLRLGCVSGEKGGGGGGGGREGLAIVAKSHDEHDEGVTMEEVVLEKKNCDVSMEKRGGGSECDGGTDGERRTGLC